MKTIYILQVNVYVTHNLLNVLVQIANKINKKLCILKTDVLLLSTDKGQTRPVREFVPHEQKK
jgi:hypothetical protein